MRKSFQSESVDERTHQQKLAALDATQNSVNKPGLLALAACLLVAASFAFYWLNQPSPSIKFQQVAFADLYNDSVSRGFKPYYDCSDPARFAAEFKRRQGIELKLDNMPTHHSMLGVSYLGGISRNTTAVLFEKNKQPIIVFVDREDSEPDEFTVDEPQDATLSVYRTTRFGLVFYEVSNLPEPQMTKYFLLVE